MSPHLFLLSLLFLLTACSSSPLNSALDLNNSLVPGSKGEQLNPTSKGEYKFSQLAGHLRLPRPVENLQTLRFTADGQVIPDEQRILAPTADPQAVYFRLLGIPTGANIVVDVSYREVQLSAMFPEAKAATLHTQNIDVTSTVAVAVARRAESEGVRALKAWSPPELRQLLSLPELAPTAEALTEAYRKADPDALGQPQVQAQIQATLAAFLKRLQSPQ